MTPEQFISFIQGRIKTVKMRDSFFSLGIHQERGHDVLYKLEERLFSDPNPSRFLTLPSDCLEW